MAASQGTMNNFTFGMDAINITKLSGGSGAGADFDGTDAVQTHMTNSRLTDPELGAVSGSPGSFAIRLTAVVMGIIMAAMASSVAYVSWNR